LRKVKTARGGGGGQKETPSDGGRDRSRLDSRGEDGRPNSTQHPDVSGIEAEVSCWGLLSKEYV
jgi:hypothetical protein